MLNLLFISNSPKAHYMKSVLQPMLKVIIDVVPDFDHGLKDVFEKRPATVCIQDHIAGVTGESVARHIQMLLGAGSPRFILMHEGSGKAKSINGLFEYVIDLNQTEASLIDNFQNILKSLLGEQWSKIYVSPKQTVASIRSAVSIPEESKADADRLVDDFLSGLDTGNSISAGETVEADPFVQESTELRSPDEIAEMLLVQAQTQNSINTTDKLAEVFAEVENESSIEPLPNLAADDSEQILSKPRNDESALLQTREKPVTAVRPETVKRQIPVNEAPPSPPTPKAPSSLSKPDKVGEPDVAASISAVAPAEFKIRDDMDSTDDLIPEELLQAFEQNYRSESAYMKRSVLALSMLLIVTVAGGWYLLKQKPHLLDSLKQRILPSKTAVPKPASSASQSQKQALSSQPPKPSAAAVLPQFIPLQGHDKKYATSNPGWERYVGNNVEFRVFSAGNAIKAVQVRSITGSALPEQLLKSVLTQFAGSSDYKVESRKNISGVTELRGAAGQKADIIIYKKNESVRAFVVSLK
ncbi:MAG TPA: hypothetical protein DCZ63_10245 [Geobacter sp.]|nr:hypothetical protein [Geobacter sp.]